MSDAARWEQLSEAGTPWTLEVARWIVRHLGRRLALALAVPTSAFFVLRRGAARRASRRYLARVAATPEGLAAIGAARPGLAAVLRHFTEFSRILYDRMRVWSGALEEIDFEHDGSGGIFEVAGRGRGALLLGAHLGSLDLLGFLARRHRLPVAVVAFQGNAARINAFLGSLGARNVRVIELDPGGLRAAFEVRACIERGEIVSMMADRTPPGDAGPTAAVEFLGREARFPLAPFRLAGVLGCPAYLALCLRVGDARYRTVLRPLGEARRVARSERDARARELLASYAAQLETLCRRHPFQWLNFYDFWREEAR